jgi:hypothetical protein
MGWKEATPFVIPIASGSAYASLVTKRDLLGNFVPFKTRESICIEFFAMMLYI